jgi:uncharacterized protein (TIGR00255 family)
MTGFGEASGSFGGVHYFVEVRSLNNRHFKATIRLPDELLALEGEIESELRRRLSRGSVTFTATVADQSEHAAYTINHKALASYIAQLQQTPQISGGAVKIDIAPLLSLPGVLQPPINEEERLERSRGAMLALLEKACSELVAMRTREGKSIVADLTAQHDVIAEQLKIVQHHAPQVVSEYENRLKTRVEMMLKDAELIASPPDLIREIAVYAERSDISEEIVRLSEHLRHFTELLSGRGGADRGAGGEGGLGGKPVGRTLDFLTQEMLREANTMGSKSPHSVISRCVVEIKGAIDRIKEQVQNIE